MGYNTQADIITLRSAVVSFNIVLYIDYILAGSIGENLLQRNGFMGN